MKMKRKMKKTRIDLDRSEAKEKKRRKRERQEEIQKHLLKRDHDGILLEIRWGEDEEVFQEPLEI